MNTVAIVQARIASTRLPGKVLADIGGKPMLGRVVERTAQATTVHAVVVATSANANDDAVADYCASQGVPCFRGDEVDVLDRFYQAARAFGAEIVVRITADCP